MVNTVCYVLKEGRKPTILLAFSVPDVSKPNAKRMYEHKVRVCEGQSEKLLSHSASLFRLKPQKLAEKAESAGIGELFLRKESQGSGEEEGKV